MAIPSAVRKQGELSDKLIEEQQQAALGEPTPEPTPAPAPAPAADPTPKPAPEHDWEGRFGRYKASTDQTIADLRQSVAVIQQKHEEALEKLREKDTQPPAAPTLEQMADTDFTDPEKEEYGPEFRQMITRVGRKQLEGITDKLSNQVGQLTDRLNKLEGRQNLTEEEKFWAYLDENVPGWEQTNASPEFIEWLQQRDPLSGRRRQDMLKEAQANLNGPIAVEFFNLFKGATSPPAGETPKPGDSPTAITPGTPPITPDNTGDGGGDTPGEQKTIKHSFVNKFYNDKAMGRYKHKPKEAERIEAEIKAAYLSGNIIEGQ